MNRPAGLLLISLFLCLLPTSVPATPRAPRPVTARMLQADGADRLPRDGRRIFLRAAVFDPAVERPDFSDVDLEAGSTGEYVIVQFQPGKVGRKADLEALGIRFFGYLPDNAFQARVPATVRSRLESDPFVRWVGAYRPGFKVHPRLWAHSGDPTVGVTVRVFPDALAVETAREIEGEHPEARRTLLREGPEGQLIRYAVPLQTRDAFVRDTAAIAEVSWIEPYFPIEPHNTNSSGPIQGNAPSPEGRTIFGHGITGTGQVVAVADTGVDVDMCFFRNLNGVEAVTEATRTAGSDPGPIFENRKVRGYWVQPGADPYDTTELCNNVAAGFHGSHTAGTAVGDNVTTPSSPTSAGVDDGDGMAPNAQLIAQDLGSSGGCLSGDNGFDMFLQAARGGAGVHSNSYGSTDSKGGYFSDDETIDRFLFDHEEMAIVFSAGNSGPGPQTTESPGNAKNVITVGALAAPPSTSKASFSSRGPTADGRIKPDIMAPGVSIRSAAGDAQIGNNNCGAPKASSGTSMAAPMVAGGAALLRQYFEGGFYPNGVASAADTLTPLAPLVKAVLLNGTLPVLTGGTFPDEDMGRGWGRIFLDNNLYFSGDSRELRVWNPPNPAGLKQGESRAYTVNVAAGQEFRATLVWSDAEGTPGAAKQLVNDLDLTVTTPAGTFLGNSFANNESAAGGSPDSTNNVEQVRFSAPVAGVYTLQVSGASVPGNGRAWTDRQGYALVASYATCATTVATAPTGLAATASAQMGVDLTWTPADASAITQIYRADGSAADPGDYQYVGTATGSTYTDRSAQGGETYSYRLRGADACGEGPASTSVSVAATGSCDVAPTFEGIATAAAEGNNCQINLSWAPGNVNCKLAQSVVYNVYRSTSADFVPSGDPLATVAGTSFTDTSVESGTTYYYVVRAEDDVSGSSGPHGGNEDHNLVRLYSTPVGLPSTTTGTWTDDAGDSNAYLSAELPWRITSVDHQSGTRAYVSGPDSGSYPNLTCASITTPTLRLGSGALLTYWARFNLEWQWDGVVVEISIDGGQTWTDLPPTTPAGYPDTLSQTSPDGIPINACGFPATKGAFTGPQSNGALTAWTEYRHDLGAHAGKDVRVRWRLTTDPASEFQGFYLDSISVTNVSLPGPCVPTAAAPVADFSFSPSSPEAGELVTFTDQSANLPTSWSWTFGDGGTSTAQNPVHTYASPGTYPVTLVVTNALGTSSKSRTVTVLEEGSAPKRRRAVRH